MDKIDEYLLKEYGVIAGACSSIESVKYQIAREVYMKAIDKACEKLKKVMYNDDIWGVIVSGKFKNVDEFINNFKQAMEE